MEDTTSPSTGAVPRGLQQEDRSPGNGGPSGDGVEVSTEPLQEQGRGASKSLSKAWLAPRRRPRNGLDKQVRDGRSGAMFSSPLYVTCMLCIGHHVRPLSLVTVILSKSPCMLSSTAGEGVAMIPIINAVLLRGLTELCPMAGIKKKNNPPIISNYS